MPSRIMSLTPQAGGEVPFSFVPGFMAKTQDPSSSAPQFEGFSVLALPNSSTNRNGRFMSCAGGQVLPGQLLCQLAPCETMNSVEASPTLLLIPGKFPSP